MKEFANQQLQDSIALYTKANTNIWYYLIGEMTDTLTRFRRGLSYTELAELIYNKINELFSPMWNVDTPNTPQIIIKCAMSQIDYMAIARLYYEEIYNSATLERVSQADSYYVSSELQAEYEANEQAFFENKYLKIFSDFFSEIP